MVGVAQLVESWNVAPDVAGSSPVAHPIYIDFSAPVAQLDRVPDFESVGRRFESCRAHSLPAKGICSRRATFSGFGSNFLRPSAPLPVEEACRRQATPSDFGFELSH